MFHRQLIWWHNNVYDRRSCWWWNRSNLSSTFSRKVTENRFYSSIELFLIDSKQSMLSQTVGQLSSSVRISLFWMLRHLVLASDLLFWINVSLMEFCVFSSDWLEFETELFAYSTGLAVSSIAENNLRSSVNQGSKDPGPSLISTDVPWTMAWPWVGTSDPNDTWTMWHGPWSNP